MNVDPVSQVLATIEMFENVQRSVVQETVAQDVRLIKATHEAAAVADGKGTHVNTVA